MSIQNSHSTNSNCDNCIGTKQQTECSDARMRMWGHSSRGHLNSYYREPSLENRQPPGETTNVSPRGQMIAISTEVLFGRPVSEACKVAFCMALHERLGADSKLACLGKLDQELLDGILRHAFHERELVAPIGVVVDGRGRIWISELHERPSWLNQNLNASSYVDDLDLSCNQDRHAENFSGCLRSWRGSHFHGPQRRASVRIFQDGEGWNEIPAQDALHIVKPFMLATNTSHSTLAHEVLCADTAGSSILVMNDTGMIIRRIGHLRTAGNMGLEPHGLAVDPRTGCVFVSCTISHRVHVFRQNAGRMLTNLVRTIGRRGVGGGDFQYPLGICLHHGCLVVADSGNSRVQVLDTLGQFKHFMGFGTSCGVGQLSRPTDVAVNREANIFVSDSGNHRVIAFNWEGQVVWLSTTRGAAQSLNLRYPCGLAFDFQQRLIIADHGNNTLVRVDFRQMFASCPRQQEEDAISHPAGFTASEITGNLPERQQIPVAARVGVMQRIYNRWLVKTRDSLRTYRSGIPSSYYTGTNSSSSSDTE